jgi:hypothetical protein
VREEVKLLEHQPELPPHLRERGFSGVDAFAVFLARGDVFAIRERAGVHRFKQRRAAQHRRLAAARGADDRYDLALFHLERHAL